jgi:hypothetical protein
VEVIGGGYTSKQAHFLETLGLTTVVIGPGGAIEYAHDDDILSALAIRQRYRDYFLGPEFAADDEGLVAKVGVN